MCGGGNYKPPPTPPPAPAPPMQAMELDPSQDAEKAQKKQKAKSSGTKQYRNPMTSSMSINTGTSGGSASVGGLNIS